MRSPGGSRDRWLRVNLWTLAHPWRCGLSAGAIWSALAIGAWITHGLPTGLVVLRTVALGIALFVFVGLNFKYGLAHWQMTRRVRQLQKRP